MNKKWSIVSKFAKANLQLFFLSLERCFACCIFLGKVLNNIVLIYAITFNAAEAS